jgi:hypothetical protein
LILHMHISAKQATRLTKSHTRKMNLRQANDD